jgi:type II secretory pathway component PulK
VKQRANGVRQPHLSRGGFATIMAVTLLMLVAVALAAMTVSFAADARRTSAAARDAQLRQLLLAGATEVAERARTWPAQVSADRWDMPVPASLAAAVHLDLAPQDAGKIEVRVRARFQEHATEQVIRFGRVADRWQILDVADRPGGNEH